MAESYMRQSVGEREEGNKNDSLLPNSKILLSFLCGFYILGLQNRTCWDTSIMKQCLSSLTTLWLTPIKGEKSLLSLFTFVYRSTYAGKVTVSSFIFTVAASHMLIFCSYIFFSSQSAVSHVVIEVTQLDILILNKLKQW